MKITVSNPSGPINLTEAKAELIAEDVRGAILRHCGFIPIRGLSVTVEAEVTKTVKVTIPQIGAKTGRMSCSEPNLSQPLKPFSVSIEDGRRITAPDGIGTSGRTWWREFREGIEVNSTRCYKIDYETVGGTVRTIDCFMPQRIIEDNVLGVGFVPPLPAKSIRSITRLPA